MVNVGTSIYSKCRYLNKFMVNVGKYSCPMEHLGPINWMMFLSEQRFACMCHSWTGNGYTELSFFWCDPDYAVQERQFFGSFVFTVGNHGKILDVGQPPHEIISFTGGCAETWNKLAQNKLRAGDSWPLASSIWNWARSQAQRRYLSKK